jgi:hypothetical protein
MKLNLSSEPTAFRTLVSALIQALAREVTRTFIGTCVDHGESVSRANQVDESGKVFSEIPIHLGWIPAKGLPVAKRWKDTESGLMVPYRTIEIDPFLGTSDAGKIAIEVLEFSGEFFKDILEALRRGQGGYKWTVDEEVATEEYWRHMDAEIKTGLVNKRTGKTVFQWAPRSKHWPNHLFDCEVEQVAFASYLKFFDPLKD